MWLTLIAGLYLAAGIYWFGRRKPGYSNRIHTISELGERGSVVQWQVSWGVFFPVGVALLLVWFMERQHNPESAALAAVIAVGYLGGAIFPCDPGSPLNGSWSQGIHNLAGGVEYYGGVACLWVLSRNHSAFLVPTVVVAIAIPLISLPLGHSVRGAAQRAAEVCLFVGLAAALVVQSAA